VIHRGERGVRPGAMDEPRRRTKTKRRGSMPREERRNRSAQLSVCAAPTRSMGREYDAFAEKSATCHHTFSNGIGFPVKAFARWRQGAVERRRRCGIGGSI